MWQVDCIASMYLFFTVNIAVGPFSCLGDGLQQASIMVRTKSKGVHCSFKRDHLYIVWCLNMCYALATPRSSYDYWRKNGAHRSRPFTRDRGMCKGVSRGMELQMNRKRVREREEVQASAELGDERALLEHMQCLLRVGACHSNKYHTHSKWLHLPCPLDHWLASLHRIVTHMISHGIQDFLFCRGPNLSIS